MFTRTRSQGAWQGRKPVGAAAAIAAVVATEAVAEAAAAAAAAALLPFVAAAALAAHLQRQSKYLQHIKKKVFVSEKSLRA